MSATQNRRIYIWINGKQVENNMKSIRASYAKARSELDKMTRDTVEYNKKAAEVKRLKGIIADHNKGVFGAAKAWGQLKTVMIGVLGANIIEGAFQRVTNFIPDMLRKNAELSDSYADVAKNADLTAEQVEDLSARLKQIDTRTPRARLLELASAAGKSGVRGIDNLLKKVRELDQVEVALGDDLGEDAVRQLLKLSQNFNEDILNIGSGINALADSSNSDAGFLTEFLARTAGSGKAVGVLADELLGYGTVIDEVGLKQEMASTALNTFLIDFTKNTEKYGQAAGFANGELTALVGSEGTNQGFLAFLQKLKESSSGTEDFLMKMEDLGINGARGSQVFLALSQNIELVREKQALANEEMVKGTSLTTEFNRKNESLAGYLASIQKYLAAKLTNSGLVRALTALTKTAKEYVTVPMSEQLMSERFELNNLVKSLIAASDNQVVRNGLIEELQAKYSSYLGNLDLETASAAELAGFLEDVNEQYLNKIRLAAVEEELVEAQSRGVAMVREQKDVLKEIQSIYDANRGRGLGTNLDSEFDQGSLEFMVESFQEAAERGSIAKGLAAGITSSFERYNELTQLIAENETLGNSLLAEKLVFQNEVNKLKGEENELDENSEDQEEELSKRLGLLKALSLKITAENKTLQEALTKQDVEAIQKRIDKYEALKNYILGMYDEIEEEAELEVPPIDLSDAGIGLDTSDFDSEQKKKQDQRMNAELDIDGALTPDFERQIDETIAYYEELLEKAEEYGYREDEIKEKFAELEKTRQAELLQERINSFVQFYDNVKPLIDGFMQFMNFRDQAQLDSNQRIYDATINRIDSQQRHELISDEAARLQREKAEEEFRRKQAAIKRKQFEREKAAAIIESIINTARGISLAIPNPALMALAAATGAVQTAVIASQPVPQFYRGTENFRGGMALVGEQGPELLNLPSGTDVINNGRTQDILARTAVNNVNLPEEFTSNGNAELLSEIRSMKAVLAAWPTKIRGDWRLDDFDEVQDRKALADNISNF